MWFILSKLWRLWFTIIDYFKPQPYISWFLAYKSQSKWKNFKVWAAYLVLVDSVTDNDGVFFP